MDLLKRAEKAALSSDQRKIVEVITSKLHKTAFLSGPELALECDVSTSAITRLSQKLGYSGFPEMKKDLESLYRKKTTPYEAFESFLSQEPTSSVTAKSLSQDLENLQRMQAFHADEKNVSEVVKRLNDADRVYVVGVASAEALVDLLAAYLEALEKPVHKLQGFGVSKKAELVELKRGDLVVGFSFQRIVREVRDVLAQASRAGAKTVAITDSSINPLAEVADFALVTPVTGTTFGLSLTAPVAMVNVLANNLAALDSKKSLQSLKRAKSQWEKFPIFCE